MWSGSNVSRALLLAVLAATGAFGACTTDHDALARQPRAGAPSGGSGGSGGFGNVGTGGNQVPQGGRTNPDVEPAGDDVLTIVNGVVDAPSVKLCFARVDADGQGGDFVGQPSDELSYGAAVVMSEIDGLSLVDDTIQPWVLAGDFSLIEGMDCPEAVALARSEEARVTPDPRAEPLAGEGGQGGAWGQGGAAQGGAAQGGAEQGGAEQGGAGQGGAGQVPLEMPTLRARAVAALPSGTVNIGRSILMVLSGCLGGAAYTDAVEKSACGAAYSPSSPTLEPVVVKLSRAVEFGKVGLQGLHAAQAAGSLDLRVSGDRGAIALVFASAVEFGAIEPRPADTRFSPGDIGVEQFGYGLQAIDTSGAVAYQAAWSAVLAVAGLSTPQATRTYTAVFLGPDPLLLKEGWWNPSVFTLVDNDPTRE